MLRKTLLALTALTPVTAVHAAAVCTPAPAQAVAAGYTKQTFGQDGITLGKNIFIDQGQTGITQQGANILITGQGNNNAYNDQISSAPDAKHGSFFGGGAYLEATFSFTGAPSNQGGWPSFWGNTLWAATKDNPNIEVDNVEWWDTQNLQFGTGMWAWGPSGAITSTSGNSPTQLGSGFNPAQPHKYGLLWTEAELKFYIDDKQGPNVNALKGAYEILNFQQYHMLLGTGPRNPMTVYALKVWQKDQSNDSFVGVPVPTDCPAGTTTAKTTDPFATVQTPTGPTTTGPTGNGSFQGLPNTTDTAALLAVMKQNADIARPESGGKMAITLAPGDLTPGTNGSVTDKSGNVFTLPFKGGDWGTSMGQPVQNGQPISDGTGWVDAIRVVNGVACFENSKGLGWGCQGSGTWVADPGPADAGSTKGTVSSTVSVNNPSQIKPQTQSFETQSTQPPMANPANTQAMVDSQTTIADVNNTVAKIEATTPQPDPVLSADLAKLNADWQKFIADLQVSGMANGGGVPVQ